MGSAAEVPQRPAFGHAPPPPTALPHGGKDYVVKDGDVMLFNFNV